MEHFVDIGNLIGLAIAMLVFAGADWVSNKVEAIESRE